MKKNSKISICFVILPLLLLLAAPSMAAAADVSIISKEDLKAQLESPDITILDARTGKDWKSSEFKIKGAIRANPGEFSQWADSYPKDKTLILYCA